MAKAVSAAGESVLVVRLLVACITMAGSRPAVRYKRSHGGFQARRAVPPCAPPGPNPPRDLQLALSRGLGLGGPECTSVAGRCRAELYRGHAPTMQLRLQPTRGTRVVDSLSFGFRLNHGSRGTSVVDSLSFQNRLQDGFRGTLVVDSEIKDNLIFPGNPTKSNEIQRNPKRRCLMCLCCALYPQANLWAPHTPPLSIMS